MSEAKFAKGNWKVFNSGSQFAVGPLSSDNDQSYGMMNVVSWIEKFDYFTEEQSEANAHLISAAPEMYDILDEIIKYSKTNGDYLLPVCVEELESLLAKARGENNE